MGSAPQRILLPGGSGGIGAALGRALLETFPDARIEASHHRNMPPFTSDRVAWRRLDLRDEDAIAAWAGETERVDWIVNCAGFLHGEGAGPEKNLRLLKSEFLLHCIRVNALPTLLLAKHFGAALKRSPAPLLAAISARVGSIEDNRLGGWYSYRISKAALNMALKTLSIEWKHSHPRGCVAALHPGTNDTALSKPFQRNVAPEQLFDPAYTADAFVTLLGGLEPAKSGRFWAWDGSEIPW